MAQCQRTAFWSWWMRERVLPVKGSFAIDRITTLDYEGYQTSAEKWAQIGYDLDRLSDEIGRLFYEYHNGDDLPDAT